MISQRPNHSHFNYIILISIELLRYTAIKYLNIGRLLEECLLNLLVKLSEKKHVLKQLCVINEAINFSKTRKKITLSHTNNKACAKKFDLRNKNASIFFFFRKNSKKVQYDDVIFVSDNFITKS